MIYDNAIIDAYRAAANSKDPSTQNGAVLLDHMGEKLTKGYNHFPFGVSDEHWHGQKEAKYARVVHAEVATIINAARLGIPTDGTILVCPWAACSNCAKHIADAGIIMLVRHEFSNNGVTTGNHWYEDCLIGDDIMREAGVAIHEVPVVNFDIKLRRNGYLWKPGDPV